jgi:hypothetical protein
LGKADHDGHDPRALTLTLEMSTLLAAFQTVQAVMAGVSVGSVAVTGAAVFVATAATVHNVVMCKKLVDAIVASKKDKSKNEIAGKEAAKRVLQEYGGYDPDNTGPKSDFNQLKKFFDTHFE